MSSFSRENQLYQSLPTNSNNSTNSSKPRFVNKVNFNMSTSTKSNGNGLSTSTLTNNSSTSTSSSLSGAVIKPQSIINSEEFAKLDALLEDLLAEVDQPIFMSKTGTTNQRGGGFSKQTSTNVVMVDDVERSVDWLSEQKELLKMRKENANSINYNGGNSKLEHFLSTTNGNVNGSPNKYGFSYTDPESMHKLSSNGNGHYHVNQKCNPIDEVDQQKQMKQFENNENAFKLAYNNKPPVSPNVRPAQSAYTPLPNGNLDANSFRSLSTNQQLLKHINETEDENLMSEAEFDRYSQRSFRCQTACSNTLGKRTKYHVVCNDYTEATRPLAPTPLPSTLNRSSFLTKRACSAPPVEMLAKQVVLQRMELKSPLTVASNNFMETQQQQQQHQLVQYNPNIEPTPLPLTNMHHQLPHRSQTPLILNRQAYYNTNPHPNRAILKSNSLSRNGFSHLEQQQQQQSQRNVFLNRAAASVSGRGTVTNGYETDSGISYPQQQQHQQPSSLSYRAIGHSTLPRNLNSAHYRQLTALEQQHQPISDGDGGLVKLRHVLENNRNGNSVNLPLQTMPNGYYYSRNSCNSNSNNNATMNGHGFQIPIDSEVVRYDAGMQQQSLMDETTIQYIDGNGNLTTGVPAFISADGRQIILKEAVDINGQAIVINNQQQLGPIRSPSISAFPPQQQQSLNGFQTSMSQKNGVESSGSRLSGTLERQDLNSETSLSETTEVLRHYPKSVKVSQSYWYKPKISRDEAISLLKDKPTGTFLIRDSNNFPGAFGLALKVDKPPANVQIKAGTDPANELVRHFLIEPATHGVRIKGCCNEPVFGNLAALVYQHSLTPLALPCKLILPENDPVAKETTVATNGTKRSISSQSLMQQQPQQQQTQQQQKQRQNDTLSKESSYLLDRGAACNVFYLNSLNVGSRNGLDAITHGLINTKEFTSKEASELMLVQFKVTTQGITLTDINKKKFLRQHFPTNAVIYCAVHEKLTWPVKMEKIAHPKIFGLVCKPNVTMGTNEVHLFIELDPDQPAIAIVDFINRYLIPSKSSLKH